MTRRFHANNVSTTLSVNLSSSATTMTVTSATGFPTIGSGEIIRATLSQGIKREIVEITDDASTPLFTISRAQEGTTAQAFTSGATVEIRATANSFDRKQDQIATSGDVIDFGDATSLEIPNSAAPSLSSTGHIALDSTVTDYTGGLLCYRSGSTTYGAIAASLSDLTSPTDGYFITYNAASDKFILSATTSILTATTGIIAGGNSTAAGYIQLLEDSDNGSNYTGFQSPSSLATNILYTLPSAAGSVGDVLTFGSSNILSWTTPASAVAGPGSSTDNAIATWNGTSGATLRNTTVTISSGVINAPADALINGLTVGLGLAGVATNTTLGNAANSTITTGNHSTAVGYQANKVATSGNDNTAFGYLAGTKVTTQSGNTSIGSQAGNQSNSTQQATMVGYKAGAACSSQDTAVGYQALMAGSGDAFGYNVLNASLGSLNVGVGNSVFSGASYSGSNGTGVGYSVFSSVTSGGNNTGVGYGVGLTGATGAAAITTGTDNTFIGYQASGDDAATTGAIAIGSGAVALKSTGSTSGTFGPGIAFGSAARKVGFRGDGTIIPSSSGGAGFWKAKINGTQYYIPLFADGSTAISSGSGGMTWTEVTGTSQSAAVNNGYVTNNGSSVNVTLPATAAIGDIVAIAGSGAGKWQLTANTGQTIKGLGDTTTSAGNIVPANRYDAIEVICITANTTWVIRHSTSTLLTFA